MPEYIIFLISLVAPIAVLRTIAHNSHPDLGQPQHKLPVPKLHHAHLGVLFLLLASQVFLFTDSDKITALLLGLGMGLVFDEVFPSIYVTQFEPDNTKAYLSTLKQTVFLFLGTTLLTLLIFWLTK